MAGISDVPSVRMAESYLYDFYLRHNIRLYEWQSSVMHGKAMIVDDTWATIGSYNLNFLSHYMSTELNADILDPAFIRKFSSHLNDIIAHHCIEIDLEAHIKKRNIFTQLLRWLTYNFFRVTMNVMMLSSTFRKTLK